MHSFGISRLRNNCKLFIAAPGKFIRINAIKPLQNYYNNDIIKSVFFQESLLGFDGIFGKR